MALSETHPAMAPLHTLPHPASPGRDRLTAAIAGDPVRDGTQRDPAVDRADAGYMWVSMKRLPSLGKTSLVGKGPFS